MCPKPRRFFVRADREEETAETYYQLIQLIASIIYCYIFYIIQTGQKNEALNNQVTFLHVFGYTIDILLDFLTENLLYNVYVLVHIDVKNICTEKKRKKEKNNKNSLEYLQLLINFILAQNKQHETVLMYSSIGNMTRYIIQHFGCQKFIFNFMVDSLC